MLKRQLTLASFLLAISLPLQAAVPASLRLPDGRTCFFSSERISIPVEVRSHETGPVRLSWVLRMHDAVVARREVAFDVQDGQIARHTLQLELPETREGITMEGSLSITLSDAKGQPLDTAETPLSVFDPDPFQNRKQWLETLQLHVYDPEGATVAIFEKAAIPFRRITNPAALNPAKGGILVIGEGLSLKASRGLMEAVFEAVQADIPVIVLAPMEGAFQIPAMQGGGESGGPQPKSLSFHGKDIISRLDKRLDTGLWAEDRDSVLRYFRIGAYRDQPEIVMDEDRGWPWIALDWPGGSRLRFCGFGVVRDWEASPVPRYLLAALLEELSNGIEAVAIKKGRGR
jgi:hypothetical protein